MPTRPTISVLSKRRAAWTGCLVGVLSILICSLGCRTSWRKPAGNEPSFERLLDVERAQQGIPAGSRSSVSSRLRSTQPPSNHAQRAFSETESASEDSSYGDEDYANRESAKPAWMQEEDALLERQLVAAERLAMSRSESSSGASAARRKISDSEFTDNESTQTEPGLNARPNARDEAVAYSMSDRSDEVLPAVVSEDAKRIARRELEARLVAKRGDYSAESSVPVVKPAATDASSSVQLASAVRPPASDEAPPEHSVQPAVVRRSDIEPLVGPPASELDWQDHLREAITKLEAATAAATNPEKQIQLAQTRRMLDLSVGNLEQAAQPVEGLDKDAQTFLQYSLQAWHDLTDPNGNPVARKRYTLALASQRKALTHLAAASDLEVQNAAFCTAVESFGDVTKFPENKFTADQEVLLYCEVDNFVSLPIPNGSGFETHLQGSYQIVDSNGVRIDDQPLPADQHVCHNQRRDYFIVYRIWVPKSVQPGRYKLKLTVEDLNGHKFGHSTLDFSVGS